MATDIKPEGLANLQKEYTPDKLLVLKLDVAKPQEVADTFSEVKKVFGRIDVVYNNAGYSLVAEAEAVSAEEARAIFDVLYWGIFLSNV